MRENNSFLSEDAILQCLARHFPNSHPGLELGRGDDCALFQGGGPFCVSTDMFLENVHFRRSYFTPEETGHKALAVNISDLAGCGSRPLAFTLALGLPSWVGKAWLERFFTGMADLAARFDIVLAGGDLSRADSLFVSITVIGEPVTQYGFLKRGGSMPGDVIFLTGPPGLAAVGLLQLEARGREAMADWPQSCSAHLMPEPHVEAGLILARAGKNGRPPALMDLSDGLARDLPRLLGQNGELGSHSASLGADLRISESVLPQEVTSCWQDRDPVLAALTGGEDYVLLGACAPELEGALKAALPGFIRIGTVTGDGQLCCNGKSLAGIHGFDHFG